MDEVERLFMARYGKLPPHIGETPSMAAHEAEGSMVPFDPSLLGAEETLRAGKRIYEKLKKPKQPDDDDGEQVREEE